MKVEVNDAKLMSFELALQVPEPSHNIDTMIERSEKIYQYIFGNNKEGDSDK